jgi:hypothetical protein
MRPTRIVMGIATRFFILVFAQGVLAADIILRNDLR